MSPSTNDESSDSSSSSSSSGDECLASPSNLDLDSTFFKLPPSKPSTTNVNDNDSSESDDDSPFDDNENIDSIALLAEVMKNLENAKKTEATQKISSPISKKSSPKKDQKNVSSDEITNLLLQGEPALTADSLDDDDDDEAEETEDVKPVTEYTIPKEGVDIILPDSCLPTFNRRKKKGVDLAEQLRKKLNRQLRSKQVLIHKVGLLCWLAYGFHLNRAINDCQVMAVSLSLVPSGSYPKGRVNLKYLEQFTKWFRSFIKLEFKDVTEPVDEGLLLSRLKEKKIFNYRELVLLYAAMLRSIGLNCRLVVSLCPPALKLQRHQLMADPKVEPKIETAGASTSKEKSSNRGGRKKPQVKESNGKIVPENSGELETKSKLEARKRAADVLAKFQSMSAKKPIKKLIARKDEEKLVLADSPKKKEDIKSPQKKKEDFKSLPKKEEEFKTPPKKKEDLKSLPKKKEDLKSLPKKEEDIKSPPNKLEAFKSPPRTRQLRSRAIPANSESPKLGRAAKKRNSLLDKDKEIAIPEKRTRTTRAQKSALAASTSLKKEISSDEDLNVVQPAKKKKIEQPETVKKNTSDSEDDFEKKPATKKITNPKRSKTVPTEPKKNESVKNSPKIGSRAKKSINFREKSDDSSESENEKDEDWQEEKSLKNKKKVGKGRSSGTKIKLEESIDRRVLSSDEESGEIVDVKGAQNIWVEVFVDDEESWISVCLPETKIHCVNELYKKAPKPVLYVVAWNSSGTIKDVTRRYCPHWLTVTRKQRIEEKWWQCSLDPWKEKNTPMSRAEDEMLLQRELEQPLPKSVGECKGHPLYALARHLLKFEAIYPRESVPLGHLKTGEAIYSRHCVHTLYSRETWIRKARVVKPAQEPYKIVKAMPKYDKLSGCIKRDLPLELFGKWQTNQYVPPTAKDGIVPRNEYGSVDLFQQCMLPFGCVHINLPALNRVARKLNIDCAIAVVGFNFGSRGALPVTEGYVVCSEFEETLREAWHYDQIESSKRAVEKREKRIYGNWKKLIKGLFIRERLAVRYDFNGDNVDDDEQPSTSSKSRTKNKNSQSKKTNCKNSKK